MYTALQTDIITACKQEAVEKHYNATPIGIACACTTLPLPVNSLTKLRDFQTIPASQQSVYLETVSFTNLTIDVSFSLQIQHPCVNPTPAEAGTQQKSPVDPPLALHYS